MLNETQVKRYCCEDISRIVGYVKAVNSPDVWVCHHLLENKGYTHKELISKHLYYGRPASELVLLPKKAHRKLHFTILRPDSLKSESWKQKLREYHTGKPLSEEHKRKIGLSCKNPSEETRQKLSKVWLGRKHTDETKQKMRETALNRSEELNKKNSEAVKMAERKEVDAYWAYKRNGGSLKWGEWRHFNKLQKESNL